MSDEREDLTAPGHFIAARDCRFFRHTHVGRWCVSTVGDYRPRGGEQQMIGSGRTHETYVFDLEAEDTRWQELDSRGSNSDAEAEANHEACVESYLLAERSRR